MLGNDIVDTLEAKRTSNWKRERFLEKIFTQEEQSFILNSKDPFLSVWRLWSMKESAYKIFIQLGGKRFFKPNSIECSIATAEKGLVTIKSNLVVTTTSISSEYIFTSASITDLSNDTKIFKLAENNSKYQSDFMQEQLLENYSSKYLINKSELEIVKTEKGIPILYYKSKPLSHSISISHHGNYGAYSISNI